MEINDSIILKLESIDEDCNSLKPFMHEYLQKIEVIISEKTNVQNDAIQTLKGNSFSVSSISKELGCSRTTMYNHNQLLKRYIEQSVEAFKQDNPFIAYDELKGSKSKLQDQINLMIDRDISIDISIEILRQNNKEISKMLKEKNKEVERLQARVHELSAQLHQIQVAGKVVSFTKK